MNNVYWLDYTRLRNRNGFGLLRKTADLCLVKFSMHRCFFFKLDEKHIIDPDRNSLTIHSCKRSEKQTFLYLLKSTREKCRKSSMYSWKLLHHCVNLLHFAWQFYGLWSSHFNWSFTCYMSPDIAAAFIFSSLQLTAQLLSALTLQLKFLIQSVLTKQLTLQLSPGLYTSAFNAYMPNDSSSTFII